MGRVGSAVLLGCLANVFCLGIAVAGFDGRYEDALKRYSIHTDSVVNDYYSSGLIGNGLLGASIYKQHGDTLCWELGRADVCDHRSGDYSVLYTDCRLPIGKFLIPMDGGSSDMSTDLYRCEVSGRVGNRHGSFGWRSFAPAGYDVLVIELKGKNLPDILFEPALSVSPRYTYSNKAYCEKDYLVGYTANPAPTVYDQDGFFICKQPLLAGGEYTTVWRIDDLRDRKVLIASVGYSQTRTDTEVDAMRDIAAVLDDGLRKVERRHTDWWHDFYSKSYVRVPEDRYNAFFWMQLYKLGSATRSDGCPIDLMGPWFHNQTPWPAIWWNLNIQLTYSPMFVVNHCELAVPLLDMLDRNVDNLKGNVPADCPYPAIAIGRSSSYDCRRAVENERGLMMWTLFYYWKYCTYTADDVRLKDNLFPLLKLAVNYYRHLLFRGDDGYLHMPASFSPEYAAAEDCNFELALLRWGCETLIDIDTSFAIGDPLLPEWKNIMDDLVPYPVDEDGFMIGKDVKLRSGHRHYSHLLMLYPLQNFPLDTPENIGLAKKSIDYWLGFKNAYYCGYTYTGASSMSTLVGDGERAYSYLNVFFDKYVTPNTLYREAGPVFETPMSALASFAEMLLSSNGDVIRIMPALPKAWKDVEFDRLLADNGFEVSARRRGGRTEKVVVKSLHGGTCRLYCDIPEDGRRIEAGRAAVEREDATGGLVLSIPEGESVTITSK